MKFSTGSFPQLVSAGVILFSLNFPAVAQQPAPAPTPYNHVVEGYRYVWGDEFDGPTLDLTKWQYRTDSKMWSKQLPNNVSVADGHLKIAVKKEEAGDKHYTGGGIISRQQFEYGYFEASFRIPPGSGWHTSFWTMGYAGTGDTKPPQSQEIDVCEQDSVKHTNFDSGVIAWGNHGKGIARKYTQTPDLNAGFHIFACEFTPQTVKFFFDGQFTHQADATLFKQGPQNIWLTCIATYLGGTTYVAQRQLPADAEFDYVRVFTK